jgi:hypothetical protein
MGFFDYSPNLRALSSRLALVPSHRHRLLRASIECDQDRIASATTSTFWVARSDLLIFPIHLLGYSGWVISIVHKPK